MVTSKPVAHRWSLLLVACFLMNSSLLSAQKDDWDGDGLVGSEDSYPTIARAPDVCWTVNEFVFTWDIDQEQLTKGMTTTTRESTHRFAFTTEHGGRFSLPGVRANFGLSFSGSATKEWQDTYRRCREAIETQSRVMSNPHWEITVTFNNRSDGVVLVKDFLVPVTDSRGNVIAWAQPSSSGMGPLTIPPRRTGIKEMFIAKVDTGRALEVLEQGMPRFDVLGTRGGLFLQKNGHEVDLLLASQNIRDATAGIVFECAGDFYEFRLAVEEDGRKTTLKDALLLIDDYLQDQGYDSVFCDLSGKQMRGVAGIPNGFDRGTYGWWEIMADGETINHTDYLTRPVSGDITFRYVKDSAVRLAPQNFLAAMQRGDPWAVGAFWHCCVYGDRPPSSMFRTVAAVPVRPQRDETFLGLWKYTVPLPIQEDERPEVLIWSALCCFARPTGQELIEQGLEYGERLTAMGYGKQFRYTSRLYVEPRLDFDFRAFMWNGGDQAWVENKGPYAWHNVSLLIERTDLYKYSLFGPDWEARSRELEAIEPGERVTIKHFGQSAGDESIRLHIIMGCDEGFYDKYWHLSAQGKPKNTWEQISEEEWAKSKRRTQE